ncbi:MAG TPA: hypothetical protein VGJ97_03750, partial [Anaerolineaceae bacterium]
MLKKPSTTLVAVLYLAIPFGIFCLAWFKLYISLPVCGLLIWAIWEGWSQGQDTDKLSGTGHRDFFLSFGLI